MKLHARVAAIASLMFTLPVSAQRDDDPATAGCSFQSVGRACGMGGVLSGRSTTNRTHHDISVTLTGAAPLSPMVFMVGTPRRTPIRLPAGGCPLMVDGLPAPARTDARGSITARVVVPVSFNAARSMQAGVLQLAVGQVRLHSSNRLDIRCVP